MDKTYNIVKVVGDTAYIKLCPVHIEREQDLEIKLIELKDHYVVGEATVDKYFAMYGHFKTQLWVVTPAGKAVVNTRGKNLLELIQSIITPKSRKNGYGYQEDPIEWKPKRISSEAKPGRSSS